MNSIEIATVFASTLYRQQSTWDAVKDNPNMDFADAALGMDRRKSLQSLTQIVETSDRDSIYEALEIIGRQNSLTYANNLAGSHELHYNLPFVLACMKLGKPEADWKTLEVELAKFAKLQTNQPAKLDSPFL